MKLTEEQYQQILNLMTDKSVDISFIRNWDMEEFAYVAKRDYPQIWDNLDEEAKENFENLIKYKFRGLN